MRSFRSFELRSFRSRVFSGLLLAAGVVAPASATLLLQDNFEAQGLRLNTSLAQWNVVRGTVDVIGPNDGYGILCNGSTRCVDLDGSTGSAGRIESKLSFNYTPGAHFELTFQLSGNQRFGGPDSLHVSFGDAFADITLPFNASFSNYSLAFDPAHMGAARVAFDHAGGDNVGLILDNVSLTSVPNGTGVPAPAAVGLAGFGVGALLLLRWRRARAAALR